MYFSPKGFDNFTKDEIGYPISKEFPNLSKGKASSKILGSLSQTVNQLTFIRNKFGTGHGRASNQPIIPTRYALLCLGSTATIIRFLIDKFENRKIDKLIK